MAIRELNAAELLHVAGGEDPIIVTGWRMNSDGGGGASGMGAYGNGQSGGGGSGSNEGAGGGGGVPAPQQPQIPLPPTTAGPVGPQIQVAPDVTIGVGKISPPYGPTAYGPLLTLNF